VQESAEQALKHVRKLLELSGLTTEAQLASVEGDVISIDITGEDSNYLIGRRGQVLDALQYLLLVMISHELSVPNRLRIHLDADFYRKRRADSLQSLAMQLADQVRATGEEAVLEPLNPMERRIVHTALIDDADVETYSEGEEPNRHIVITPRRKS
jgi:spoIIIJ-associated protein